MPDYTTFMPFDKILGGFYTKILIRARMLFLPPVIHDKIMYQFKKPFFVQQLNNVPVQTIIVMSRFVSYGLCYLEQIWKVFIFFFGYLFPVQVVFFFCADSTIRQTLYFIPCH